LVVSSSTARSRSCLATSGAKWPAIRTVFERLNFFGGAVVDVGRFFGGAAGGLLPFFGSTTVSSAACNEFFNGYARILGTNALGVYCSLCRHADKLQKSYPSQTLIAEELSISRNTVVECMKALEIFNVIRKIRVGKMCTNRYYLIDKKHWVKKDDPIVMSALATSLKDGDVAPRYFRSLLTRLQKSREATSNSKETQKKGNPIETVVPFKNKNPSSVQKIKRRMYEHDKERQQQIERVKEEIRILLTEKERL